MAIHSLSKDDPIPIDTATIGISLSSKGTIQRGAKAARGERDVMATHVTTERGKEDDEGRENEIMPLLEDTNTYLHATISHTNIEKC